jgi:D-arabinose 1-dehydrogenase-like Zn-dependent alcohol dehydrogenase
MGAFYRGRRALFGSAASDVRDVVDSLDLLANGSIKPKVGSIHRFEEFQQAYHALADPARNGKVVIQVRVE